MNPDAVVGLLLWVAYVVLVPLLVIKGAARISRQKAASWQSFADDYGLRYIDEGGGQMEIRGQYRSFPIRIWVRHDASKLVGRGHPKVYFGMSVEVKERRLEPIKLGQRSANELSKEEKSRLSPFARMYEVAGDEGAKRVFEDGEVQRAFLSLKASRWDIIFGAERSVVFGAGRLVVEQDGGSYKQKKFRKFVDSVVDAAEIMALTARQYGEQDLLGVGAGEEVKAVESVTFGARW